MLKQTRVPVLGHVVLKDQDKACRAMMHAALQASMQRPGTGGSRHGCHSRRQSAQGQL